MKLAVIGSRGIVVAELEKYIPQNAEEIVSGGARGVDTCAAEYARSHGKQLTEFLPDYSRFGRGAPYKRNEEIVKYADEILAFWDGKSKGTEYVIGYAKSQNKRVTVINMPLPTR